MTASPITQTDGNYYQDGEQITPVCMKCGGIVHLVAGATENGQPVEIWHHDSVADDVFCGLVMHAADRLPR